MLLATDPDDEKDKRVVTTEVPPIDLPEEDAPTTDEPLTYSEPSRLIVEVAKSDCNVHARCIRRTVVFVSMERTIFN